ncbi:hypothetical protein EDB86DRAFT_3086986 [Lactarius hatsudake]|nr:hypothetical protein EDB86DRAFT_3086986 [Lactarius hatsudake]
MTAEPRLRTATVADYLHTLTGPVPTPFSGDPAQAQQFIDEFGQFERANRRHPFVTQPTLRVELALTFIRGPTVDSWKCTVRRGRPNEAADEDLWDEFFDSFCTAWINDTPTPMTHAPSAPVDTAKLDLAPIDPVPASSPLSMTLPTSGDEPLASVPTDPPTPVPDGILKPTITPSIPVSDSPPPRPPRITETEREETLYTPTPASPNCDVLSPLNPAVASSPTPVKEDEDQTLAPRIVPARMILAPENTPSHRAATPPPRPAPGDPTRAASHSIERNTVVKDDNVPKRGVKTLDNSVFAPSLAEPTQIDPPPLRPPRIPRHSPPSRKPDTLPRHMREMPRSPEELANRQIISQRCGNARPRTPVHTLTGNPQRNSLCADAAETTPRTHQPDSAVMRGHGKHTRQDKPTISPAKTPSTTATSRPTRIRRRVTAAALSIPPPQELIATRNRDTHIHTVHPRPADIVTALTLRSKNSSEQHDAAQTTPKPIPVRTSPAYDAVAEHLAFCLTRKPDIPHITQPFPLNLKPSAILRQWKTR